MTLYTAYEQRFYAELERFGLIADGKLTEEGLKELNAVRGIKIPPTGGNKLPWYRKP